MFIQRRNFRHSLYIIVLSKDSGLCSFKEEISDTRFYIGLNNKSKLVRWRHSTTHKPKGTARKKR